MAFGFNFFNTPFQLEKKDDEKKSNSYLDLDILYADVSEIEKQRAYKYKEFWKMYRGDQTEIDPENNDYTIPIVNYCDALVRRHVSFLFKNGFDIIIPDNPSTDIDESKDKDFIKVKLDETWQKNLKLNWIIECGVTGFVTGDVFIRASWEANDPFEDPFVRLDVIPSEFCFPEFGGPKGVDRKKMDKLTIIFPKYTHMPSANQDPAVEIHKEVWTNEKVEYYINNTLIEVKAFTNELGEIPVIHIANYPIPGEYYGESDLKNITVLQKELNNKNTDISEIINYHGAPLTVFEGAKIGNIEIGPNRTISTPEGSKVYNLEIKGDLGANLSYLDRLQKYIFELTDTPDSAFGHGVNGSEKQSAAALTMEYLPMMDKRLVKEGQYGVGFKKLNRLILVITEKFDNEFKKEMDALGNSNTRYKTEIVFPEPFPRDESLQLERIEKKIELGIMSRKSALMELGHGETKAQELLDEAMAEKKELMEMQMESQFAIDSNKLNLAGKNKGNPGNKGNPNPKRPNPDVQSEKASLAASKKA